MPTSKVGEVGPTDLWHVSDLPSDDLDDGMASIVEMVHEDFISVHRCRIDEDGYLRMLTRGTDDLVPKGRYKPLSRSDYEER